MLILPPLPTPPAATVLKMFPLTSSTEFVARTDTLPAFPCPKVLAVSAAPSVKEKEPVVILMLPPLPTPPAPTVLKMFPLTSSTEFVARTDTLPAFPCPKVLAISAAPSVKEKEPVVILMLPPLPTPPACT
ncbi:hypothetical protein SAMD00079811_00020 [Scytonema sp. HK-05]|nr:hypothetical protein SAMD00079811_00020 [Scytonema sp. HK-05]